MAVNLLWSPLVEFWPSRLSPELNKILLENLFYLLGLKIHLSTPRKTPVLGFVRLKQAAAPRWGSKFFIGARRIGNLWIPNLLLL